MSDFRFAIRQIWKAPAFTVTALATVAVCLGANLAIFAVIDSVLLRPLPFPNADRLVTIYNTYPKAGVENDGASITNYYERRGNIPAFESLSMFMERAEPETVHCCDRARTHCEDIAENSTDAGCSPLERLDKRRVIVRFDLERDSKTIADVDDATREIVLMIHWTGGRHSELRVKKNSTGHHNRCTSLEAIEIIRQMAGRFPDDQIAATLNRGRARRLPRRTCGAGQSDLLPAGRCQKT